MVEEIGLSELKEAASHFGTDTQVAESNRPLDTADGKKAGWVLSIESPSVPRLEIHCIDRARARRTLLDAILDMRGERGLLRAAEADDFASEQLPPHLEKYNDDIRMSAEVLKGLDLVLEAETREEEIQIYLADNPVVWRWLTQLPPRVFPKLPLGHDFVTDFAVFGAAPRSQNQTPTLTLVEIERSKHPLFTKGGNPSQHLTHGERQLIDWKGWVSENKGQLRDLLLQKTWLPFERHSFEGFMMHPVLGFEVNYLLVIGRRATMTTGDLKRLQQKNGLSADLKVITYDVLRNALYPELPYMPYWMHQGD